ncbi:S-phase kinase-associated protein 2 [Aricia agestis]|uniref:S-phase kinase-associated protein 2 n=1 Tax=Aricia agestis TaxID=91739 RepID=UPI001C20855D|nr:S-phase kinase-associated protein 2 [Aricia agestis]
MNLDNNLDVIQSSPSKDEEESPRKRMRLENSARKSWSLMDRKTDTEVLQEMGVSLLEPDDNEMNEVITLHKANLKRKRDIENVNPNVNIISSPRSKHSPKSPRAKVHPSPGPSRGKSPRSLDKSSSEKGKPLQSTDHLDTSLTQEYLAEETPLAQSVSADYHPRGQGFESATTTTGKKQGGYSAGTPQDTVSSRSGDDDSFHRLPDEVILAVFRWLPKLTLSHCMLVCKRWYRLACDETLWQRLDLGNKTISKDSIGRILARKPVIVRLASSEIGPWRPLTVTPSRVQYLDLSMCGVDGGTLERLLQACPALRKLSLENLRLTETCQTLIGKCSNMETLNLTMTQGITADGLTEILQGCTSLQSLNISWANLCEEALLALVSLLPPKIQRLNISGTRILTDECVSALALRCGRLVELDVSDCARLGAPALAALRPLSRLEHLALSRCYLLPPHALTKLSAMPSLQYLEVWGMLQASSLQALRAALPAIQINQFMFSAIARPTVGPRRTSVWGLRTRD